MKSKRFEPIREIASNLAGELSRAMADAARRVAELERQLEQLTSYRDEYARNGAPAGRAMDAVKLQNYRSFLDRKRRLLWSDKRIEAESLGRAVERFRKEEQHAADRREQRDADATALRISLGTPRDSGN